MRNSRSKWALNRSAYTLFEVLLALGLSGVLMLVVYGSMSLYWQLTTIGRIDTERGQLARTLIRRMSMDIRSLTYKPADTQLADSDEQAAEEGAGNTSGDSEETVPVDDLTIIDDGSYLNAEVHLIGDTQSLEMIVLRPTRNRTGNVEDDIYADTNSDRRKVGYMFSATGGIPGLYYRNADQLVELANELEGITVDPTTDYQLLAAEVAGLEFQYLEGTSGSWVSEWNSYDMAGLPRAIKITFQFHSEELSSDNQLRSTRTNASTQVFQTIVQVPLSETPESL